MQSSERKSKKTIQIQGPFFTHYSLAIVNRNLALALEKESDKYHISLYADQNISDYMPTEDELKSSEIKSIFTTSQDKPDFAIRNTYPFDRIKEMEGKHNFAYFFWEESVIPKETVDIFNNNLDGLIVATNFVKEVAINSGVIIPIEVIHSGVIPMPKASADKYKLKTNKKFKFFHNSSGFARKGVDILIDSYFKEFTDYDDVVLIIKSYPNPHNNIESLIEEAKQKFPNPPEVLFINDGSLTWEEMSSIYHQIDCVVLPTRCEGFGLPQAEALLSKKPLITTGYSGHMDFCTPNNSWLVKYKLVPSDSHLSQSGSVWAQPSGKDLRKKMSYVFNNIDSEEVKLKVEEGYKLISEDYTWERSAKEFLEYIDFIDRTSIIKKKRIALFTTWNTKCGIAKYTSELYANSLNYFKDYVVLSTKEVPVFKDNYKVKRMWLQLQRIDINEFEKALIESKSDLVHIQHHSGHYDIRMLCDLIAAAKKLKLKVLVTLHSLEEFENYHTQNLFSKEILHSLNLADTIYTHKTSDQEFLEKVGLKNIKSTIIGNYNFADEDKHSLRKAIGIDSNHVICAHGFLLPHKNFDVIIDAVAELKKVYKDIVYLMVTSMHSTNESSYKYYLECKKKIKKLKLEDHVILFPQFLSLQELRILLHAPDMILLPYGDTKESASAAIRNCLGAKRPVLVSDSGIFDEVKDVTLKLDDLSPTTIANTIKKLYSDPKLQTELIRKANDYMESNAWELVSKQFLTDLADLFKTNIK
jgi:glycosyltransferase involved in cell wall biosynthesis